MVTLFLDVYLLMFQRNLLVFILCSEGGGSRFLRNIYMYLPHYMESIPEGSVYFNFQTFTSNEEECVNVLCNK